MLPFLIVDTIIAENNEVTARDTDAKIVKSDCVTPVPEKVSGMPDVAAAFVVPPSAVPRLETTCIKTPDKAKRKGPATTVAKLMKIT